MSNPGRKAEIRKKAAQVFAEKGFDRASIRDVAKAAEMSLAGLYYYYRGKEEILFDIEHTAFTTLLEGHSESLAGVSDPIEKLDRIIDMHISFFIQNISEMKVMVHETNQLSGQYLEEAAELRRRYVRLVRGILEEIKGKQKVKDISTGTASFLLFGMMNWLYTWYSPDHDADPKVVSAAVKEVFLNGYLK
jgi:AcrR family transcriptional regulator